MQRATCRAVNLQGACRVRQRPILGYGARARGRGVATLEVEGPDSGWVASIGFDAAGEVRVLEAREDWDGDMVRLLARLLQQPAPSGRIPADGFQAFSEDALYDLADSLRRYRPLCRGERLMGYVTGGSRYIEGADYADE